MLDLGATTFWEDFDISWKESAARIDEIPQKEKQMFTVISENIVISSSAIACAMDGQAVRLPS